VGTNDEQMDMEKKRECKYSNWSSRKREKAVRGGYLMK
jgi:hypothetical protein